MTAAIPTKEGFVSFRAYHTWYRTLGDGEEPGKLPVLCLHGGPGLPHDYLEPLEAIAATGRRAIFYDQLGCGNSDQPHDPALWTVDLFVEEVGAIRRALGLERVHILGQSWGGMVAMAYGLTQPAGLASLTIADSLASVPQWMKEMARLRSELPPETQETLAKHEAAKTTDDPAYQQATSVFYSRHLCRLDPWPECLNRAFEKLGNNPEVSLALYGSEFYATGGLKDWDILDRLGEIRAPTLVLGGRYDQVTPAVTEAVHRGIPASGWLIFEHSSHLPHLEETDRFMQVLTEFLSRVERPA